MIDWLGFNHLLVFIIKIIPENHVFVLDQLVKCLENYFLGGLIIVIFLTLLLKDFHSNVSVAGQKFFFFSSDWKMTFNLLLLPVNLDGVSDHEILSFFTNADSFCLKTVTTVDTITAPWASVINGNSIFHCFL